MDTQEKRDKLWCVCNRPGREVGVLLLHRYDMTTKISFLSQKSSFFSPPPDWHLTALRHRRHHRLRHASRHQRLRQRGRDQHQGHSERGSPEGGGYSGGKPLKRKDFVLKSRFTHFSLMAERMLLSISEWQAYSGTPITVQRPLIRKSLIFCHFLSHCSFFFFSHFKGTIITAQRHLMRRSTESRSTMRIIREELQKRKLLS